MTSVLCAFTLLLLGGPQASAISSTEGPPATSVDCTPNRSSRQLPNCTKAVAAPGDILSAEPEVDLTPIMNSFDGGFPGLQDRRRLTARARRTKNRNRRMKGHNQRKNGGQNGGQQYSGDQSSGGNEQDTSPSDGGAGAEDSMPFMYLRDYLNRLGKEEEAAQENSNGGGASDFGEQNSGEHNGGGKQDPVEQKAGGEHYSGEQHSGDQKGGEHNGGEDHSGDQSAGEQHSGSHHNNEPFPVDNGSGEHVPGEHHNNEPFPGDNSSGDGNSDNGFDAGSLTESDGDAGANGGQANFIEETFGEAGDGGENQMVPDGSGDHSFQGEDSMMQGGEDGADGGGGAEQPPPPPAAFEAEAGGPPRSGNGKPFEQCPSAGKWNIKDWNLEELIGKNFYFYEIQQSGHLPADNRVAWRGDSFMNDKHKDRLLNYGWFDAGDHLKLMFPMGWTISTMAWSIIDGQQWLSSQQYDGNSNLQWAVKTLEYGLEFLLDCSFENGEFVAQIGETNIDHWHVFRAEKDNFTPRTEFVTLPPMTPGSDLLYQSAAAYAAGALALRKTGGNGELAARAERQAKDIYIQGNNNPGIYSDSVPEVGLTYSNNNWQQYGFLASAWLFSLTGEQQYKADAEKYYTTAGNNGKDLWADYSWNSVYMGGAAVMYQATGEAKYEEKMAYFAQKQLNADGNIHHTPKGLMYMSEWGPLRYAAGGAGIMAMYARSLNGGTASNGMSSEEIMAFAEHQLAYILGADGHSFVSGYGCNPPRNPHHRNACLKMEESDNQMMFDTKEFNEYELTGAVVGGPDINDQWTDDRKDYKRTEVALDYNAAMLFAAVQIGR